MTESVRATSSQKLYSVTDAAQQLGGIGRTTIYELAKRGEIDFTKIGSRSFVSDESLNRYLETLQKGS